MRHKDPPCPVLDPACVPAGRAQDTGPAPGWTLPGNKYRTAALLLLGALAAGPGWAQFSMVPAPLCAQPKPSEQVVEQEYRIDAARHLYACYPMRVYRGRLPPLLYGIMLVEVEIDTQGAVVGTSVIRKPAAEEVGPWVLAMIRRASPYPAPVKMTTPTVKFTETYFVDKSGLFQTFSLTEGQR